MHLFYSDIIQDNHITLSDDESRHVIKVLRIKTGDFVWVTDGKGRLYRCVVRDTKGMRCVVRIEEETEGSDKRDYRLHIAISPLKSTERFEWFIEKSVEIGIDEITPIICTHTERATIKTDRIKKIIVTAMKQSLKTNETVLNEPAYFSDFITQHHSSVKAIAHCQKDIKEKIANILSGSDILIMIGPEGDFSEKEIQEAKANNFVSVSLGASRLRTETAGIVACHAVYHEKG